MIQLTIVGNETDVMSFDYNCRELEFKEYLTLRHDFIKDTVEPHTPLGVISQECGCVPCPSHQ